MLGVLKFDFGLRELLSGGEVYGHEVTVYDIYDGGYVDVKKLFNKSSRSLTVDSGI